ncbi:MAG: hypothetical protein WA399_00910 [Acidobacteriaceae bacterium]
MACALVWLVVDEFRGERGEAGSGFNVAAGRARGEPAVGDAGEADGFGGARDGVGFKWTETVSSAEFVGLAGRFVVGGGHSGSLSLTRV